MDKLLLLPVISEKTMQLVSDKNTYVFEVAAGTSKIEIEKAVEDRYNVEVISVNTTIVKGKVKQSRIKGGRKSVSGQRSDKKKAYVSLKSGDSIKMFEGNE